MTQGYAGNGAGKTLDTNSTTATLSAGATFTGEWVSVEKYASVTGAVKTDQAGTMYMDFSVDGSNLDSSLSYAVTAGTTLQRRLSPLRKYFRVRFTNTAGSAQTYIRLQCMAGFQQISTSKLNSTIAEDSDTVLTRGILTGQTDSGSFVNVPVTPEGHLEVAVHEPLLPFGSVHTENLIPIFQADAVYLLNPQQETGITSGSGTATVSNSMYQVTTGTTVNSQGVIQSRKRLRYRAGQGVVGRFTAAFTTPVTNSYQLAGFGNAEDGVYVGYGDTNDLTNTSFGVLWVRGGVREVKTLTITTGATSASNVTITLNGTAFTVAVTASSNIQRTVWEISQGTFSGWNAYPSGATVVFVRSSAGTTAGTQSFSAGTTGSAGSIVQTRAGVASTDTFISQADFNNDTIDGNGESGFNITKTNLNIFQIGFGYLGTDSIVFRVKKPSTGGNNSTWVTFHTINLPNSRTTTSFRNPSFPFTLAAYSAGSTTDLTIKTGSYAGFIEGNKMLHGGRFTYYNQTTAVTDASYKALFTIMNKRTYAGVTNQAVINLLSVSGAIKHTSPVIFYLIRGGTLAGNPNFTDLATSSCSSWDTSAAAITWATGDQLLATFHVGDTGEFDHHFGNGTYNMEELTLQPGEYITLAARATTGTPSWVTGSINTREDQ